MQYNNDWNVPPVFTADTQWTKVTLYLRLPQLEEGMIASLKPFDNINDTDAVLQIADISIEKVGSQGQNLIQNGQFLDGENGWSFAGAARSIIETQ